jgi:hypothetical protein
MSGASLRGNGCSGSGLHWLLLFVLGAQESCGKAGWRPNGPGETTEDLRSRSTTLPREVARGRVSPTSAWLSCHDYGDAQRSAPLGRGREGIDLSIDQTYI